MTGRAGQAFPDKEMTSGKRRQEASVELGRQFWRSLGHHPTDPPPHSLTARGGQNYDLTAKLEPFPWQAPLMVSSC